MDDTISDATAFHLRELEYLRKEIEYRTLGQSTIERDVVIAVSAVYTALATLDVKHITPPLAPLAFYFWTIPFLIAVAGAAKFAADHYAIRNIGQYILKLEGMLDQDHGGWEGHRAAHPQSRIPSLARRLSWVVLILLTIAIPTIVYYLSVIAPPN